MGEIVLHSKVKLKSGIEGVVNAIWQETPGGDIQYMVKYWNRDGEQKTRWFPPSDFDVMD